MSNLRPCQRLPLPFPCDFDPSNTEPEYFYNNFAKHFIPDMIQMMDIGLKIDKVAVEKLRKTVEDVLRDVTERLEKSPIIQKFQLERLPAAQRAYAEKCTAAVREVEHYLKPYNTKDVVHRTWVVNTYLKRIGKVKDCKDKWVLKNLKSYNIFLNDPFVEAICDRRRLTNNDNVIKGMLALAEYKLELWNKPRYEKSELPVELKPFNPGSSKQVKELFEMLKIEPLAFSKDTGEASWGRDQIEELQETQVDEELLKVLQTMVDYSYSSIIKSNFLKAFDTFTVDGILHGNIKLFGAKSFRNTSNQPNLLNMPSTGSIYAKPLKKCFTAPEGFVIYTADLNALEDRVIANLSGDANKLAIFTDGVDGHSLATLFYNLKGVEHLSKLLRETENTSKGKFYVEEVEGKLKYTREFPLDRRVKKEVTKKEFIKGITDEVKRDFSKIRQISKKITFGLSYGAFPPKVAQSIKCALEEAERIFNVYHNELFPGITKYREEYVLPTARRQGYIHLGLGCRLYTSDAGQHIRTLNNATVQFWSILTLIAINEFNHRLRQEHLEEEVQVISTIYDSVYAQTLKDPEIIKWVNDNLIELMCVPYLENETIHNEAEGEIGLNFADLHKVPNGATVGKIKTILEEL